LGTYKMRSAKMRKCENGQRIKCELKCEVVFAFYTLQRINCEIKNAKFQYLTTSHRNTFV